MKCNVTKTSIYPNFPTTQPSAPYSDDLIYERHLMSALFCYCLNTYTWKENREAG